MEKHYHLAVDCGRTGVKVIGENGYKDFFPSNLGTARELNLSNELRPTDIVLRCWLGDWFIGTLAEESFDNAQFMSASKIHIDTKLLILTAIARAVPNKSIVTLTTGVPIDFHTPTDKLALVDYLKGHYQIEVNGEKKSFTLNHVNVGVEGISGYVILCMGEGGRKRFIDLGSRTVNFGEMFNGRYVDMKSGTLNYGCNTDSDSLITERFARKTMAEISVKWRDGFDVPTYLIGGGAYKYDTAFAMYLQQMIVPEEPEFINAKAYYEIGESAVKQREQVRN